MSVAVTGPGWLSGETGRFAGRFPLAAERHILRTVDRLLPGVTTVTPLARYYCLHALVAATAQSRGLDAGQTLDLLRRAEVVLAAVSLAHGPHEGWPLPHGADRIGPQVDAGTVNVSQLSQPGVYAVPERGFLGPYLGSERTLGLVIMDESGLQPGERNDAGALRAGLGSILDLVRQEHISSAELTHAAGACMCQGVNAADGALLRELLQAADAPKYSRDAKRSQTITLLARLLELHPVARASTLWPDLAYGTLATDDPVLAGLEATDAWRGVVLRAQSVTAWRSMWAWIVNAIPGAVTVTQFRDTLADTMPDQSVAAFLTDLPPVVDANGQALPAERDRQITQRADGYRQLSVLALGGQRLDTLDTRARAYFEGPDDAYQELIPSWVADFFTQRVGMRLRDAASELAAVLIARSQRIAMSKSFVKDGVFKLPTRVFMVDDMVVRDSAEGSGEVGLRWDQLTTVLAGVGIVERVDGLWKLGAEGQASGG